ncbi:hypothetical protein PL263_04190 [Methylomonas sp. EFPC3]|uniref:hypothetical protein n=1 Tax=Methylomonas sp. EFPC3 TaxID=3021710 RepID=UPI002415DF38|nr:hypothetical protein [Methylomonas sp. EFPC3]WFP51229.1 hypothetical protein PL263_04190 [Methylomonas sp. EFPC3]
MSVKASPTIIEQQHTLTNPLHPIFSALALSYGMVMQDAKYGELSLNVLDSFVSDCEEILAMAYQLRQQFLGVQA